MQTLRVVVLDIPGEGTAQRGLSREARPTRQLRLERVEERLGARIVAGTADTRALPQPVARDKRTERRAHVLGAAIAVEDESARRATTREGAGEHATCLARGPTRLSVQARTRREW